MPTTAYRRFAAPDAPPGAVLIQATAVHAAAYAPDDIDDLLGLGPGEGHDELTQCDVDDCRVWFWADEGASVHYESGTVLTVCARHAVADDPGALVYPGSSLLAAWEVQRDAEISARIRATGQPW